MQTEWVTINQVPTKVLTWGKTLTEAKDDACEDNSNYIICICGNPGIPDAYIEFLEEVHKRTNNVVWILSHAGHSANNATDMPPYSENRELYGLEGQIKHKIAFIEEYVPTNAKITLIGHSVGSYIILRLLRVPTIQSKVAKSYLLFPTIEYIGSSPNGKKFMRFIRSLCSIILIVSALFSVLPKMIQNFMLHIYLRVSETPSYLLEPIRSFVQPYVLKNVFSMALQEMLQIKERDNKILTDNRKKIKIYYGAEDGWCPLINYHNIKKDIPDIDAEICDKGYSHSFVLKSSLPMAVLVSNWIKDQ